MADTFYPPRVQRLFDAFDREGEDLYLVGGAVRDRALGASMEELDDLDFCTSARPDTTERILREYDFDIYELGKEFGTVGCILHGPDDEGYPKDCQITTYRSDEYYRRGSRHPEVQFGDTIDQDLSRRDFSINSMAMDGDGEVLDPYGGAEDLEDGILRVIGDPSETLAEDPLRILRVGRFMSRLDFQPREPLREACRERADHLLEISRERWFQSMTKLLTASHPRTALEFLEDVRALGIMLPEVASLVDLHESSPIHHKDVWDHTLQVVEQARPTPVQRWAALLHDVGKPWTRAIRDGDVTFYRHEEHGAMLFEGIRSRFRFDNETADAVGFIVENHGRTSQYDDDWSDAAVRRYVRDMDPYVEEMLEFARADLTTSIDEKREEALERIDELASRIEDLERERTLRPDLPSGLGYNLMETFELGESPLIGELKDYLEDAIIDGRLENDREARYYVEHLADHPPDFLREALEEGTHRDGN
jgi:poly(A) polymerase